MEFWPADFRVDIPSSSTKKRRGGKEAYVNDQTVEPGTLGAATLASTRRPVEWTSLVQPRSKHLPRVIRKAVEVFPSTKPPSFKTPRLTIHQRAEQGARFLRTYHGDIDIPFELIKDEMQSDEEEANADAVLNPYIGNKLAHFFLESTRNQYVHFLAFACGETSSDLNISPFGVTRDKRVLFSPSARPVLSFETPIQQIASFTPFSDVSPKFPLLATRTHSAVSVINVQGSTGVQTEGPSVAAATIASISVSETGNRRVVDMSCSMVSSSNAQILFVNDMGDVYQSRIKSGKKTLTLASDAASSQDLEVDQFWRIARGDVNTGMRTSGKKVHLFDLRARSVPSMQLFHLAEAGEYMTSIEAPSEGSHTMCFSTTSKLVWFDERNLKSPVLSFKHQRAFDRSLRVQTIFLGPLPLATLSSTANHLVTIYDVNHASSGHLHMYGEPGLLSGSSGMDLPIAGSVFFRHPAESNPGFNLFQMSHRGSLWKTDVGFPVEDVTPVQESVQNKEDFEWTEDMHALARKAQTLSEDIGQLGGREYLDANLRAIYEKIFDVQGDAAASPEGDPEAVYQTLEKMPFFWQDINGPADHIFTTFDVAFQSGLETFHASRADFLTESLLSSPQGFFAVMWDRIPVSRLASTVRWHHDLATLPPRIVPDLFIRPQLLVDQVRREALAHAATAEGMRRATEASQHLTLDLALSRHVYAPQPFVKSCVERSSDLEDSNLLLQATQAMSLGAAEPPPVHFGFLRPVARVPYLDEEQMESADESSDAGLDSPLGVRLLLSQWEIGTDPAKHKYKNPYEERDAASSSPLKPAPIRPIVSRTGKRPAQANVPANPNAPRPPLVVASTSRRTVIEQGPPHLRLVSTLDTHVPPGLSSTQPISTSHSNQGAVGSSQEALRLPSGPSSQPLRGPFGGGAVETKKKAAKKRIGGF